jgi:GNAT superfamily N-acetyltransferase
MIEHAGIFTRQTRPVVEVRRATVADGPALARLRWVWRVDERAEQGSSLAEFTARFVSWMADHEPTHHAYLAEDGADPVGMAWLAVVTRVPGPEIWRRLAGAVQSVYVLPHWRNAGIGELLVQAAIEQARELSLDYLMVHPSDRSFSFYRRMGFAEAAGELELSLSR